VVARADDQTLDWREEALVEYAQREGGRMMPEEPAPPVRVVPAARSPREMRERSHDAVNLRILAAVRAAAGVVDTWGCTVDELAVQLDLDVVVIAPRVFKLEHETKELTYSGHKRVTRRGSMARVMAPGRERDR
jgi:hypothetical protein